MTSRRVFLLGILLLAVLAVPASAQDAAGPAGGGGVNLNMLGAAFAIGVAAAGGALARPRRSPRPARRWPATPGRRPTSASP